MVTRKQLRLKMSWRRRLSLSLFQAPQWLESDSCQKCEQPFFWNIKQMWDTKTLGLRQVPPLSVIHVALILACYSVALLSCVNEASQCSVPVSYPVLSITAGSVVRPFVGSVVLNAPRTPSWALSSRCACVTTATTQSKRRSEFVSF